MRCRMRKADELNVRGIDEIPQHVDVATASTAVISMPATASMPARARARLHVGDRRGGVVVGDGHHASGLARRRGRRAPRRTAAVGGGGVEVEVDHRGAGARRDGVRPCAAGCGRDPGASTSARYSRIEQLEMLALLVGELEEDLLAFGVLEPLAVFLEEPVRAALAADADQQRLLIVDAARQPLGAFGEQAVGGALEEQERRPRLELRIALQQLARSAPRACRDAPSPPRRRSWNTLRPRASRVTRAARV